MRASGGGGEDRADSPGFGNEGGGGGVVVSDLDEV